MDAWTWTVFQLMTQAAMQDQKSHEQEAVNFVRGIVEGV